MEPVVGRRVINGQVGPGRLHILIRGVHRCLGFNTGAISGLPQAVDIIATTEGREVVVLHMRQTQGTVTAA